MATPNTCHVKSSGFLFCFGIQLSNKKTVYSPSIFWHCLLHIQFLKLSPMLKRDTFWHCLLQTYFRKLTAMLKRNIFWHCLLQTTFLKLAAMLKLDTFWHCLLQIYFHKLAAMSRRHGFSWRWWTYCWITSEKIRTGQQRSVTGQLMSEILSSKPYWFFQF